MKNYVQSDDVITVTAPYDCVSGQGVKVGSLFGIATNTVASGAPLPIKTRGVWDLAKLSTDALSAGDKVYWDDTNKRLTSTATSNTYVGAAVLAAANPSATVQTRLNGSI